MFIVVTLMLAASTMTVYGRPPPPNNHKCKMDCKATFQQCITIPQDWLGKLVCIEGRKVCFDQCKLLGKINDYFQHQKST